MTTRIHCCVPFCRATRGDRKVSPVAQISEWICARHWKAVPARLKRRRAAARRLARKGQTERAAWLDAWLWRECKRAAIEAAGGIG